MDTHCITQDIQLRLKDSSALNIKQKKSMESSFFIAVAYIIAKLHFTSKLKINIIPATYVRICDNIFPQR